MNARHAPIATLLFLLTALIIGCGGAATPEDQAASAGKAYDAEKFDEAYTLYQELLDWKGEGEVPAGLRFKASLESCKCQAQLGKFDEAVAALKAMEKTFPDEMNGATSYTHSLNVGFVLNKKLAPIPVIVDLLKYATDKFPEQKEKFGKLVAAVKAGRELTDEEKEAFRGLGYL